MPKMKSKKSVVKRFRVTASGKVKRAKQNHRHILTKKSPARKRRLRQSTLVSKADEKRIKTMMVAH
ncbi:MAG TPA: 50S ribosomal protein L35 [Candidatus Sumerlaeota bacterium]|nr:50S ribosomal protein L35 [Candidatus Sumerlaeota bacterium]HMX62334.1 50S ribosomal protein L35 [Candidatus Sumerlaeota bacterium]HMZ51364.1 50S ribosomal protein L35 [Candidatus Sumerlaeota bacterium]